MRIRSKVPVVIAAASLFLGSAGLLYAAVGGSVVGPDGVVHGCYQKVGGALRLFDPSQDRCGSDELPIAWSEGTTAGPHVVGQLVFTPPPGSPPSHPIDVYAVQWSVARSISVSGGARSFSSPSATSLVLTIDDRGGLASLGLQNLEGAYNAESAPFALTLRSSPLTISGVDSTVEGVSVAGPAGPGAPSLTTLSLETSAYTIAWQGVESGYNLLREVPSTSCAAPSSLAFADVAGTPGAALAAGATPIASFGLTASRDVFRTPGILVVGAWSFQQTVLTGPPSATTPCLFDQAGEGAATTATVQSLSTSGKPDVTYTLGDAVVTSFALGADASGNVMQSVTMSYETMQTQ